MLRRRLFRRIIGRPSLGFRWTVRARVREGLSKGVVVFAEEDAGRVPSDVLDAHVRVHGDVCVAGVVVRVLMVAHGSPSWPLVCEEAQFR